MSVSDGKNGLVLGVGNTPFMGPIQSIEAIVGGGHEKSCFKGFLVVINETTCWTCCIVNILL